MRSVMVLGVIGSVGVLAACGKGEVLRAVQLQAPAVAIASPGQALTPLSGDGIGSSIALARIGDRKLAIVADADAHTVRLLDTRTEEELPVTELRGEPSQLVVAGDGRVFVGVRDAAEVDVLEQVPGERPSLHVTGRIATAEEPVGLSLTPDGRTLLVACAWGREVDAFETHSLGRVFRAPVAREPRAIATSSDGRQAYVSHASASVVSVVDLMSPDHAVEPVRLEQTDPMGQEGRLAWRQGYALARADMGIIEPGVTANTGDTTVRTETYGGVGEDTLPAEQFDVAVVGGNGQSPNALRTVPMLQFTQCLLPRAAAYDAAGEWLLVACEGSDTVWRVDVRPGKNAAGFSTWRAGSEPTGIAIDAERRAAFVWSQGSRTVTSFVIDAFHPNVSKGDEQGLVRTVALGPRIEASDPVELGRKLFHTTGDTRISLDGRACASCHPDGRDDGLVWATPDGPRQTPTLAGRLAGTAPYGWNGSRSSVKKHVTNTLKRLGGTGLDAKSMDALVAYCMKMQAAPHATLAFAVSDPLVAEGRELFESSSTGCASCHMADGTFTDGNRHDVGSRSSSDPRRAFDTPSLRFVGGTGPYFHDGRYPTLRGLLLGCDDGGGMGGAGAPPNSRTGAPLTHKGMGHTAQLSPHELDALEAYLKTL
jgi:DNA-binding beta-propeller fold protein YncE